MKLRLHSRRHIQELPLTLWLATVANLYNIVMEQRETETCFALSKRKNTISTHYIRTIDVLFQQCI